MRWDHPHAYGDKKVVGNIYDNPEGSSPRVWGQEFTMLYKDNNMGIIPTRMGTSLSLMQKLPYHEDHPHAYGDKQPRFCHSLRLSGSSPRVWGQVCHPITRYKQRRIIPTRMGTSLRGDGWVLERNGSSPRVWGQVSDKSTLKSVSRIIPTRMGTRNYHTDFTKRV